MTATTTDPPPDAASRTIGDRRTEAWVRLSRGAAAAVALWSVVLQFLIGEAVVPLLAFGMVFAAFVPFLRGAPRGVALGLGVLAALAVLGNLPPSLDELTHPSSIAAFVPSLWVNLAGVVALVAGLGAFFRWPAPVGAVIGAAGGVFALGVIVAAVAAAGVESDAPLDGDVAVVAHLNEFEPDELVVAVGTTGFWLDNEDGIRHTLTIEEADFEIDAPGYSQQRGDVELEPGGYTVICSVPGHESMKLDLTVEG